MLQLSTNPSSLPPDRMARGERLLKMAKIFDMPKKVKGKVEVKKLKKPAGKSIWNEIFSNFDSGFPTWGQNMAKDEGKYVKIRLEDETLNINTVHPMLIGKILEQYFTGNTEMNKSKNCIILKTRDKKQYSTIMNLKNNITVQLNGQLRKVIFEELVSRNQTKGIVFEESWKLMSEEEIKNEINKSEGNGLVKEVKQVTKKDQDNNEEKTKTCIITFDCSILPERTKMCGQSFAIRQYFPRPMVCGKCLELGHVKSKCQNDERCRKCGNKREEGHECIEPKCPSCPKEDNTHAPNGEDCPAIEVEKLVIDYKIRHRVSYSIARSAVAKIINEANKTNSVNNVKSSYAVATAGSSSSNIQIENEEAGSVNKKITELKVELERKREQRKELEKLQAELKLEVAMIEKLERENRELMKKVERGKISTALKSDEAVETPESMDFESESSKRAAETVANNQSKAKRMSFSVGKPIECQSQTALKILDSDLQNLIKKCDPQNKKTFQKILKESKEKEEIIEWYLDVDVITPVIIAKLNPDL